ncbi:MAG TPA: hypothetical protein VM008_02685 [Phycisphaerae bacterium]|nr:hypothetical protein [Phycisphaerae bacterium]
MCESRSFCRRVLPILALAVASLRPAWGATLRVATYNLDSDTTDFSGVNQQAYLETVLEGIGSYHLSDNGALNAQPVDILAVQELQNGYGATTGDTLSSIVTNLNAKYGTGIYAADNTTAPTTGAALGNGPNGLVYNASTLQVVSATPLGTPSGSGEARAPMEYLLHPIGYSSAANFYVIVSHMKSSTGSSNIARRDAEAAVIANSVAGLGSNAHVIVLGDFNITSGSTESTYQTLISKLDDVALPSENWSDSTTTAARAISPLLSESATSVRYRDDIQFVTPNADPASASVQNGLQYSAGSCLVFGNGGATTVVSHAVTDTTNNPNALSDLPAAQRTAVLTAETNATDHLPVVADYTLVGLTPVAQAVAWISGRTGTWSTSSNWNPATIPNNGGTLSYAVTINGGTATLNINATINSLNLASGTLTGSSNLTLSSATVSGSYNVTGTTTIAPDNITGTTAGTIVFAGTTHNAGAFTGSGNITINPGATLTSDGITINQLTINGASIIRSNGTSTGTSRVSTLQLGGSLNHWTGSLDITNNSLIVEAPDASTKSADLSSLQNQVASFGKAGSLGITSSTLPLNFAIAVLDNALTHFTTFGGLSMDANSILITPALLGDANADGHVDLTDLSIVLNNFGSSTADWSTGNFDGASSIDLTDLSDVLNNFGLSYPTAAGAAASIITSSPAPEPASLTLTMLALPALLKRRKRNA